MRYNSTTPCPYLGTPSPVPNSPNFGNQRHDLTYLLDTLDAVEPSWGSLPAPYPLFIREIRSVLLLQLGYAPEVAA